MSDAVIRIENLGKKYQIQHRRESGMRYKALRDVLADKSRAAAHKLWNVVRLGAVSRGKRAPTPEDASEKEFWALRDLSIEIQPGEVLGIVGRNGAGKSTLLKILSRVTEPTTGRVEVWGRVGSLLEVGTGFHPELTGRENIFLNGAILGMTRAEIVSKFDEIVAFADLERFLDTPVKRYSSGMYMRLAFAVAAHLQPEILIVDEVLAVGDADFQKKCLGKMSQVSKAGRTVLFVSHQMTAIQTLCSRGIVLNKGMLAHEGSPIDCVRAYLKQDSGGQIFEGAASNREQVGVIRGSLKTKVARGNTQVTIKLRIVSDQPRTVSLDLRLSDENGGPVAYGSLGTLSERDLISLEAGMNNVAFSFDVSHLANGAYSISLDVTIPFKEYLCRLERCLSFTLARPAPERASLVLTQKWGYGSFELTMSREECNAQEEFLENQL